MPLIRTPEERFHNLPGYPFAPHYVTINGARIHYVDEGAGEPILCLHGEPSWSYLYRKMIPPLAQHNRVIAPDFVGFGKSDKYTRQEEYSLQMHLDVLTAFITSLDLQQITVVVQDWGGLLGLSAVAAMPERFARLVIMNTMLPSGRGKPSLAFTAWRLFAKYVPDLPVGFILQLGTYQWLPREIRQAYKAPFPGRKYKAGARVFPALVPLSPQMDGVQTMLHARTVLRRWQKPALVMFSDKDPILRGGDRFFRRLIPTAAEQPAITIHDAGHFLQEDKGEEIAAEITAFLERTPHSPS